MEIAISRIRRLYGMPLATGLGRCSAIDTSGPMTAPSIGRLVLAGVRGLG